MKWVHTDIKVINFERTVLYLIETGDQLHKSGLTTARVSNQGNFATGWNMQIDAFEDSLVFQVAKDNVLKGDLAFQLLETMIGHCGLNHFRSLVEYFFDALNPRCSVARQSRQL